MDNGDYGKEYLRSAIDFLVIYNVPFQFKNNSILIRLEVANDKQFQDTIEIIKLRLKYIFGKNYLTLKEK